MNENNADETSLHLLAIRRALAQGNAAVMVGAGFSRNAEGGDQLSTWQQLAEELSIALNPSAKGSAFSTSNVTQLGEQYAAVFSPPSLEELLKRMVPDDRVVPGLLHTQLLSLPWSDIFTTNYDTLLERAADKMVERAHFTVCCREDIPMSKVLGRRRIVKLHGSFPSQRPFIFTEEDYRTYPEKFAPFVNLVRQALLENVFCLIGFSGEDPNFLHWLGWVRDMLDRHALPVYLFLFTPPNLGQRRLLEQRGVTPVILPIVDGSDSTDYAARFTALFAELSKPLEDRPTDWGKIYLEEGVYDAGEDARYLKFHQDMKALAAQRASYPGWLVAPRAVRSRLRRSMQKMSRSINERWLRERLRNESPFVALAAASLHAWLYEIILVPLEDSVAQWSTEILREAQNLLWDQTSPSVQDTLKTYGITNSGSASASWESLACSVTRWARQGLRDDHYREVGTLLTQKFPKIGRIDDFLQYESILLNLHRGERTKALAAAKSWTLKSSDPYYLLRKAALVAEGGELDTAFTYCKQAIQHLRDGQRMRPGDLLLISQEAWAGLIALRFQNALSLLRRSTESTAIEGLEERLEALERKGYSPQNELDEAICALEAEAPLPAHAKYRFAGFDLARHTQIERFGTTSELQSKIHSSFEWLELADRVCLPYGAPTFNFFGRNCLQAAWWARYADSMHRVLSICIRSQTREALNPKDESKPPHKTGWLSRYQVATLDEDIAASMCTNLFEELVASQGLSHNNWAASAGFNIEVISRLVLRVRSPEWLFQRLKQTIELHGLAAVQASKKLWTPLSLLLSRLVEALPNESQMDGLTEILRIAFQPPPQANREDAESWVAPFDLIDATPSMDGVESKQRWRVDAETAVHQLEVSVQPHPLLWQRIGWFHAHNALTDEQNQRVSQVLWRGNPEWPTVRGFIDSWAMRWPAPVDVNLAQRYLRWLEQRILGSFFGGGAFLISLPGQPRAWGMPADNSVLEAWLRGLQTRVWSEAQFLHFLGQISSWWQEEGALILENRTRVSHLDDSLRERLHLVDLLMAEGFAQTQTRVSDSQSRIHEAVIAVRQALAAANVPMHRSNVLITTYQADRVNTAAAVQELVKELVGADETQSRNAAYAAQFLLQLPGANSLFDQEPLVDGLVAIIFARRMPVLPLALLLVADYLDKQDQLPSTRHLNAIDAGLSALAIELKYQPRESGSDIVEDAIPVLRLYCAHLAHSLRLRDIHMESADHWLSEAPNDPMPELRHGRYTRH